MSHVSATNCSPPNCGCRSLKCSLGVFMRKAYFSVPGHPGSRCPPVPNIIERLRGGGRPAHYQLDRICARSRHACRSCVGIRAPRDTGPTTSKRSLPGHGTWLRCNKQTLTWPPISCDSSFALLTSSTSRSCGGHRPVHALCGLGEGVRKPGT